MKRKRIVKIILLNDRTSTFCSVIGVSPPSKTRVLQLISTADCPFVHLSSYLTECWSCNAVCLISSDEVISIRSCSSCNHAKGDYGNRMDKEMELVLWRSFRRYQPSRDLSVVPLGLT